MSTLTGTICSCCCPAPSLPLLPVPAGRPCCHYSAASLSWKWYHHPAAGSDCCSAAPQPVWSRHWNINQSIFCRFWLRNSSLKDTIFIMWLLLSQSFCDRKKPNLVQKSLRLEAWIKMNLFKTLYLQYSIICFLKGYTYALFICSEPDMRHILLALFLYRFC